MPIAKEELIFDAIRRTLASSGDSDLHESRVAQATINTLQQIVGHIEPIIGIHGVEVLFYRSLYLTSKEFFWLAPTIVQLDKATIIASLKECLEAAEMDEASKASYELLVNFTKLLIALIGVALTSRLLEPVWAQVPPISQQVTQS